MPDYQGPKMVKVVANNGCWTLQIVKRGDAHRFVVLPNALEIASWRATSNAMPEPSPLSCASPWTASCSND
jgi:hypothetical protein